MGLERGQEPIVRSTLLAFWLLVPDPFSMADEGSLSYLQDIRLHSSRWFLTTETTEYTARPSPETESSHHTPL